MPRVHISARVIDWPPWCACCLAPADTWLTVSSTRTTGVNVVRHQTKDWHVPYCGFCLAHFEADRELVRLAGCDPRNGPPTRDGLDWRAIAGGAVMAAAFTVYGAILIHPGVPCVAAAALAVAFPFGLAIYPSLRRAADERHAAALDAWDAECAGWESRVRAWRAAASFRPTCAAAGAAVGYLGWHGTVHGFDFESAAYAGLFRRYNPGKVLPASSQFHW